MKKFLFTSVIAVLVCGSAFADTNIVSSANVVGYLQFTDPTNSRYVLVAAPFSSGTGTVSTLLDVFGTNQLRQSTLAVRCDTVIMWNPVAQSYVRYAQKPVGTFHLTTAFTGPATNPVVTRGQALWVQAPAAAYAGTNKIVYIAGNVPNDGAYTNLITGTIGNTGTVAAFSFIANPYPAEMDLYSLINTNDGARANALAVRADNVRIWSDATQQYAYYALKTSANTNVNNKWLLTTAFTVTTPPVVKIQPGQGFWYSTTNAMNWVESKPYNLETVY